MKILRGNSDTITDGLEQSNIAYKIFKKIDLTDADVEKMINNKSYQKGVMYYFMGFLKNKK